MSKKFYAVRSGRKPGIYLTWPEAKDQISGFKNAEYKSFKFKAQAENYLNELSSKNQKPNSEGLVAYVDGSFNKTKGAYSYGVVLLKDGNVIEKLSNSDNDDRYAGSYQIAGECFGALNAMRWAINHGYKEIKICYDYMGIEKWAKKEWQAKKPVSQDYVAFYDRFSQHINVDFVKVKAHSGIEMNDLADQLAKDALKK